MPHDTLDYFEELIETTTKPDFPMDNVQYYPLHLNRIEPGKKLGSYVSEFNLNPDVYGYKFPVQKNDMAWELSSQNLSYTLVNEMANQFNGIRHPFQKIAGFEMQKYTNIGIPVEDLHNLYTVDINKKYDIKSMNEKWLRNYYNKLRINNI